MKHRRIGINTVIYGFSGVVLAAIGLAASAWWLVLVGVVMLAIMAWGIVRFRRSPME